MPTWILSVRFNHHLHFAECETDRAQGGAGVGGSLVQPQSVCFQTRSINPWQLGQCRSFPVPHLLPVWAMAVGTSLALITRGNSRGWDSISSLKATGERWIGGNHDRQESPANVPGQAAASGFPSKKPRDCPVCLFSRFSRVPLFATLWTVAHQALLSMGFSRQEYWVGYHALLA